MESIGEHGLFNILLLVEFLLVEWCSPPSVFRKVALWPVQLLMHNRFDLLNSPSCDWIRITLHRMSVEHNKNKHPMHSAHTLCGSCVNSRHISSTAHATLLLLINTTEKEKFNKLFVRNSEPVAIQHQSPVGWYVWVSDKRPSVCVCCVRAHKAIQHKQTFMPCSLGSVWIKLFFSFHFVSSVLFCWLLTKKVYRFFWTVVIAADIKYTRRRMAVGKANSRIETTSMPSTRNK